MTDCSAGTAPARPDSGFTLIELLVSLLLTALILTSLGTGLSTIAKGWDRYSFVLANQDMMLRAQVQFRKDVVAIERISWSSQTTSTRPPARDDGAERDAAGTDESRPPSFIFEGRADRLRFVVNEPPRPARAGPYILSYGVSTAGRLERSRARYHPDLASFDSITFKEKVALLEGPYRYRFSYGDLVSGEEGISEAWRWFPDWPHTDRLPALIKLEIRHRNSNRLLHAPVLARPRIDAEAPCAKGGKTSNGCTVALTATKQAATPEDNDDDRQ